MICGRSQPMPPKAPPPCSPSSRRPREAIAAARAFAAGGRRDKALRDVSWAALKAARETKDPAASQAARAAMAASSAAYLHPLANATQVKHILGAAAHAARTLELAAGGDPAVGAGHIATAVDLASPALLAVLRRYPPGASRRRAGRAVAPLTRLRASNGVLMEGYA